VLRTVPAKIAGIYLLLGGLWIVLSDHVLFLSGASRDQITNIQTFKGWFFILASATLIYGLARYYMSSVENARAALQESEARFQGFMRHVPAITFIKDPDGRYLFVNQRASVLHELNIPLFAGKTDAEVFSPNELRLMREADQTVLQSNRHVETLLHCTAGAGPRHDWLLIEFPLIGEGGQRLIGGIGIDVTERHRAQKELRAAKEAAEASSLAKDQFLSVLSHELRTPLTPALLAASALANDTSLPAEVREDADMIRQQVDLESRLIDDLLDLSRINSGKLQVHPEPTDTHALLHKTARMFHAEMRDKDLSLVWHLDAARAHANVDPDRLQQCFWNLLGNAIKFTPAGGTVTIRTRNEGAASEADEREVQGTNGAAAPRPAPRPSPLTPPLVVDITDTGIGIASDVLPRLFNAFEQADQTLTRQFGGLGLGLSIARAIADLHGGSLSATSPGRNRGATFTLQLPTIPAPAPAEPSAPGAHPVSARRDGCRILVVEDEPITQNVLARLLRTLGHSVSTASSVDQAVLTARQHEFDLLISDIGLPDGSGWDILKQLGDHRPARAIAVSGYGNEHDVESSREAGFDAHLTKPIDFSQLQQALYGVTPRA
jgi:PAS domain S-box-containing protein